MVPYPVHPFLAILPVWFTYSGECWVTWWVVLGYIVKSVGLYGRVLGYMMESAGLHGGIGYMVECTIIWWEYWVTWWGVLSYIEGVLG